MSLSLFLFLRLVGSLLLFLLVSLLFFTILLLFFVGRFVGLVGLLVGRLVAFNGFVVIFAFGDVFILYFVDGFLANED